MTNLARIYDNKAKTETNITTRKTYLLDVEELYVESGYNIREIDQTHVEEFRDAFIAGEHVPPLAVQVTEQSIKIIDGHHRYHGAKLAKEAGTTFAWSAKASLAAKQTASPSLSQAAKAARWNRWNAPLRISVLSIRAGSQQRLRRR